MRFVLYETFGTSVDNVVTGSAAEVFRPLEWLDRFQSVQVLDGFVDCGRAFFRAEGCATRLLEQVSFKALEHLLEVGDAGAGVIPNLVLDFENLPIHLRDITRQCKLHFY